MKSKIVSPAGLRQPFPISYQIWDDITFDFIEGLPISFNKDTILVAVDRLSKSAHFLTLSHPSTAKIMAEKFVGGVIKLLDLPKSIISDWDPVFINKFWQEFFKMSGQIEIEDVGMRLKMLGVMMRGRSELQGATASAGTGRVEDEDDLPVK
uniref:Integrase catalytic domain-containing protein n=1 Tax=Populus alba TaxID=43335 RepID=A0A4U5N7K0_POPAL|nr:hypothetical protein D5086_0000280610 [Populus alba]